jgi:preprotein translocase subunit SecG
MNVTLSIVLGIVLLVAALFLIIAVLLQNGKSKGTGVVTGGAETFFGKSKAKSIDKKLGMLTAVVAVIFFVIIIGVFMIEKNGWFTPDTNTSTSTSTSTNTSSSTSSNTSTDTSSNTVEHDHDGDGKPDHGADEHN